MANLKPIKVKIFYNNELKKITGKDFEEAVVSENLNFINFLNFIFSFCFRSTAFGSSTQSDPIAFYLTISGLTVHD